MATQRPFDLLYKECCKNPVQWSHNCKSIEGSASKLTKNSLWIHGFSNPSWTVEEPKRRELPLAQFNQRMYQEEVTAFVASLRACTKNKDLRAGTRVHQELLEKGLLQKCSDALVTMYAKCGALAQAKELLDMHKSRDVFAWTDLIAGYAQAGQGQNAWDCFKRMKEEGLSPDAVTFNCILKACGSIGAIDKGEQIHDEIARQGLLGKNIVLGNALVDMYAKCGALAKARRVLEELPARNVVSWSALMAGYAQHCQGEEALKCFELMKHEGLSPNAITYVCILKACGSIGAVDRGKQIHDQIAKQGLLENNVVLGNALVDMYGKCGALAKAQQVLQELPIQNVVSWNALITGYVKQGDAEKALDCFERMQQEGLSPNEVTFLCILKACGSLGAADKGEQIHDEITRQGLLTNNCVLATALVDMYARCGALGKAQQILEELPVRDVVSWSALIEGYAQQGQGEQALHCFEKMQHEGFRPNAVTFLSILKACGNMQAADKGEQIHDEITRQGLLGDDVVLGTALVDMYAKCGALAKAQQVLEDLPVQNVVSWNALITGHVQRGQGEQALKCFEQMQREGLSPGEVTFLCILKACGSIGAADRGEQVHDEIARRGLLGKNIVLGNALVDMYAKCGALAKAQVVLEELPVRDVVSWSALILGYAQQGQGEQALDCFERMQREGLSPNAVTFLSILKACASIGATDKGEQIHDEISRRGLLGNDIVLGNALVGMYAKCGALAKAQEVVEELPIQSAISQNTLIAGYAQQGQGEQAMKCFERMQGDGLSPDAVTLLSILKACGIVGLIDDAQMYFLSMHTKYGIKPDLEHFTCMVDIFGRAGHLNKAIGVIEKMPCSDYSIELWSALLGACRKWGDLNVGRWAFQHAIQVDKSDAAAYVLMANIYAAAGMQEDANVIQAMRAENEAWKINHLSNELV